MHVVKESLTILNVSRVQISENRHAITELIVALQKTNTRITRISELMEKQISKLEQFIDLYLKLDLIIDELKQMTQRAMFYLENIRLQLNLLSMGRLSPSIISPSNLRQLLLDVKARLPTTLKLPNDPQVDLWFFYKHLTCVTVLEADTILIVITIPLLDLNGKFEVFKAISIPFPLQIDQTKPSKLPDMVAGYEIEATNFIINRERTKYALLTQKETHYCSDQSTKFCALENAIFPINLSKLCVIALFMKNEDNIKRFCQKVVRLDTTLPTAIHLFQNKWAIASKKELRFSTVCHKETESQTLVAKPVVDIN